MQEYDGIKTVTLRNGIDLINTYPYAIRFLHDDETIEEVAANSMTMIHANPLHMGKSTYNRIEVVTYSQIPNFKEIQLLSHIYKKYPDAFVVGTDIAARMYPELLTLYFLDKKKELASPNRFIRYEPYEELL